MKQFPIIIMIHIIIIIITIIVVNIGLDDIIHIYCMFVFVSIIHHRREQFPTLFIIQSSEFIRCVGPDGSLVNVHL